VQRSKTLQSIKRVMLDVSRSREQRIWIAAKLHALWLEFAGAVAAEQASTSSICCRGHAVHAIDRVCDILSAFLAIVG